MNHLMEEENLKEWFYCTLGVGGGDVSISYAISSKNRKKKKKTKTENVQQGDNEVTTFSQFEGG